MGYALYKLTVNITVPAPMMAHRLKCIVWNQECEVGLHIGYCSFGTFEYVSTIFKYMFIMSYTTEYLICVLKTQELRSYRRERVMI